MFFVKIHSLSSAVKSLLSVLQSQRSKVVEEQVINRRLQRELLERETKQM